MSLIEITPGSEAKSQTLNDNFDYLEELVVNYSQTFESKISSANNNITNIATNLQTVQDSLTSAGTSIEDLGTELSNKASSDLSNISATGKENISRYGKPNYSAGISKAWNTQYTAETNGWLRVACTCGTQGRNQWWYLYINDIAFKFHNNQGDWDVDGDSVLLPISKGQTYKATEGQDWKELTFFPDLT